MFELTPFARIGHPALFDPFKEIENFERAFFPASTPALKTDIRETETAYILEADLPGFEKEDIKVSIDGETMTITASREEKSESGEKSDYIRRERTLRSYSRSFGIEGISADEISAAYKSGVLTLTLPKAAPQKKEARTLEIN